MSEEQRKIPVRRTILKPIRQVEKNKFKAYAALFGDEKHTDWYGTYFDKSTNFRLEWFKDRPWLYDHTMNAHLKRTQIGSWQDWDVDAEGLFFIGEMISSFEYWEAVDELTNRGVLYPSSGTLGYTMDWDWDTGHIKEWPIVEVSSTTRPAEYRMEPVEPEVMRAIRSLEGGIPMGDKRKLFPGLGKLLGKKEAEPVEEVVEPEAEPEPAQEEPAQEEVSVEELATALHLDEIVTAIQMLDDQLEEVRSTLEDLRAAHNELASSTVESVKKAMSGGGWLDNLHVASKHGKPEPVAEGVPAAAGDVLTPEEVERRGGPSAIIRAQQQR